MHLRLQATVVLVSLVACGGDSATPSTNQMRTALAALAGAEDVYYSANHRYSADPSVSAALTLPPGVALAIWSADEGGWSASASHDSAGETCFMSGRNRGDGAFAVLEGPTCTDSILSSVERQARARGPNAAAVPSVSSPTAPASFSVLLPGPWPHAEELGYPLETVDRLAVRRLLFARSFDALDALFSAYSDSVLRDYRFEYYLYDAYGAFRAAIPALEPPLTEWVQQRPQSAAALLARGNFLSASGWHARGAKWARETSSDKFRRMEDFFRLAVADVVAAQRLAPRSIMAYYELMTMAGAGTTLSRQLIDEVLPLQPNTFLLRVWHMNNLEPRWGGSYEAMEDFAAEAVSHAARNPRMRALQGFADCDRGRQLEMADRPAEALEAYGRALQFGNYWQFLYQRGTLYAHLDRFVEAYNDLTSALAQRPQNADVLVQRAYTAYSLGRVASVDGRPAHFSQAFRDIDLAVELNPANEQAQAMRASFRQHIPQFAPPARP